MRGRLAGDSPIETLDCARHHCTASAILGRLGERQVVEQGFEGLIIGGIGVLRYRFAESGSVGVGADDFTAAAGTQGIPG